MQAIEFETILQQGSLKIPAYCSNWEGQVVKVIILHPDAQEVLTAPIKTNLALTKLAGIAQGSGESIAEKHDDYLYGMKNEKSIC
jgi:non-ribosomal peptide synthetase component E (peptide arylation enzyme)